MKGSRRWGRPMWILAITPVLVVIVSLDALWICNLYFESWRNVASANLVPTRKQQVTAVQQVQSEASETSKASAADLFGAIISKYSEMSISVSFIDLATGGTVNSGSQQAFTAASTTKVITAACYLDLVERGRASLDTSIYGSSARSQIELMINQSNNTAWRALKSWMGYETVETYAHQVGLSSFDVYNNTILASDEALLLQKLYQRILLNQSDTALLLSFMRNTINEDLIPAALPLSAAVYHKYGLLNNNLHDAAIVEYGNRAFVLVVFTNSRGAVSYTRRASLIHEITEAALAS